VTLNEGGLVKDPRRLTVLNAVNEPVLRQILSLVVLKALGEGYSFVERSIDVATDEMLVEAAASTKWDMALVLLNNLSYKGGRRTAEGITVSSINFLHYFTNRFSGPVIAFYGHASTMPSVAYQIAGAFVALPLPCTPEDVWAAFLEVARFVSRNGQRD